jgi:hypothetical protein
MHYTVLVFSVPTYVSALPLPSSGVLSRVHNPQCIQFTFTTYNFCICFSQAAAVSYSTVAFIFVCFVVSVSSESWYER